MSTTALLPSGLSVDELVAALIAENQALIAENQSLREAPQRGPASKGGLSRMVEDLVLNTTLSYKAIVDEVLKEYPDAKTTNRSVASVACVLRRTHKVPYRSPQNA